MKKLIFVPRPFPTESPTSLLIRTAQKNGFMSVAAMCIKLAVERHIHWVGMRTTEHPLLELLCEEAPPLAQELRKIFYQQPQYKISDAAKVFIDGQAVSPHGFRTDFCPCVKCLKSGYCRPAQDLKIIDICPYHNIPLLLSCPKCGLHNKWYDIQGFKCSCGFYYASLTSKPPFLDNDCVFDSSFGPKGAKALLNKLHKNDILRSKLYPQLTKKPKKTIFLAIEKTLTKELNHYQNLPLTVFEAPWLLVKNQQYREHALAFLHKHFKTNNTCKSEHCCHNIYLNRTELFHALDSNLKARKIMKHPDLASFRCPSSNVRYYHSKHLCSIIQTNLQQQYSHTLKSSNSSHSTLKQAALKLHTNATALTHTIKRGFLPNTIIGDRAYFIPNTSITSFAKTYVFSTELAQTFGLPVKTICHREAELNLTLASPKLSPYEPSIYFRSSIQKRKFQLLKQHIKKRPNRKLPGLKQLKELSQKIGLNLCITKSILVNHCNCLTPNKNISKLEAKELIIWRNHHLTIPEACKIANINQLLFDTRFINTRLITTKKIYRTNFIEKKDIPFIKNHLKQYISILQASRSFSITENRIRSLAASGKLKSCFLQHEDGHQQLLIERVQKNIRALRQL